MIRSRWAAAACAALLGGAGLMAQPSLTTIQDTLYKADGSRFDGFAFIEWKSFETSTGTQIATQSVTTRVAGGILRVHLTPTTTAPGRAYYEVKFNSGGRIAFTEYWAVPPSTGTLSLRDVRMATPPGSSGSLTGSNTAINISDVVGLQTELNNRPLRGGGYVNSRSARINASGALDAVTGNLSDCVRVDGTSTACGGGGSGFVDNEVPTGTINGTNAVFTLGNPPNPASSLTLYRNGVLQRATIDYSISGSTLTFQGAAIPQTGDSLLAMYRVSGTQGASGAAGGHLTGFFPNPSIAAGVLSDFNINASAAIAESKLALNFPTHSNANDPSTAEKAALAGTSGAPSASNRFVTNADTRLTDSRTPAAHGLLSASHGDTAPAVPSRGDVIVAQGTAPASWSRLPIGAANRCLMSNGADAVWNTCLFTGFTAGSVPFIDGAGLLAQNNSSFTFDTANRRLSVGNNQSLGTGYFWDASASGATSLLVRAGTGQSTTALQRWIANDGTDLAFLSATGDFSARTVESRTTSTRAGFRDRGSATDPTSRLNGDMWYNTAQQTRKTMDAGRIHTVSQVICNSTGLTTTTNALLGNCFIPEFFLDAGDRLEIQFNYDHSGTASDWNFGIAFGPGLLISRNVPRLESLVSGRSDGAINADGLVWASQAYGSGPFNFTVTTAKAGAAPSSAFSIGFYGAVLNGASGDNVRLLNFTVIRYPANANPF